METNRLTKTCKHSYSYATQYVSNMSANWMETNEQMIAAVPFYCNEFGENWIESELNLVWIESLKEEESLVEINSIQLNVCCGMEEEEEEEGGNGKDLCYICNVNRLTFAVSS